MNLKTKDLIASIIVVSVIWLLVILAISVMVWFVGAGAVIGSFAAYSFIRFFCAMVNLSKSVFESKI